LFNKTKFFGIGILIPILVNIIVFDAIFFDDGNYGAMASAILYLILLLVILFINRVIVLNVIKTLTTSYIIHSGNRFKIILITGAIILLLFGIDQTLVNILGH